MPVTFRLFVVCVLAVALLPPAASAQAPGNFYTGAAYTSFRLSSDDIDDTVSGMDVMVGAGVLPWMSAEFQLLLPGEPFSRHFTAKTRSFAPPGSSREEIERLAITERVVRERDGHPSPAVAVVFHPSQPYRVMPALIAGVTWHRYTLRETSEVVDIPAAVDPSLLRVGVRSVEQERTTSYPTIGGRVAIAVARGLVVIPEVRLDYGSVGDQIDHTIRSSIRAEWRF